MRLPSPTKTAMASMPNGSRSDCCNARRSGNRSDTVKTTSMRCPAFSMGSDERNRRTILHSGTGTRSSRRGSYGAYSAVQRSRRASRVPERSMPAASSAIRPATTIASGLGTRFAHSRPRSSSIRNYSQSWIFISRRRRPTTDISGCRFGETPTTCGNSSRTRCIRGMSSARDVGRNRRGQ